jgi:hypothetical protein
MVPPLRIIGRGTISDLLSSGHCEWNRDVENERRLFPGRLKNRGSKMG